MGPKGTFMGHMGHDYWYVSVKKDLTGINCNMYDTEVIGPCTVGQLYSEENFYWIMLPVALYPILKLLNMR